MLPNYDLEKKRLGGGATAQLTTITPDEKEFFPANFPYDVWDWQQVRYMRYWGLFTGEALKEEMKNQTDKEGNPILRYPLQINFMRTTCFDRANALWGEVPEGDKPLVGLVATPIKESDDALADEAEAFVNDVWVENNARSLMREAGDTQQALGGIVFRFSYDPTLPSKISISLIQPEFFLPICNESRPDELLEVFVVYRIPAREAEIRYGDQQSGLDPLYIEHWTREKVSITLNGVPLKVTDGQETIVYDNIDNPFGEVPFVYIPTERVGSYYGISVFDGLEGMQKELNARWADLGDAVSEGVHRELYMTDVSKVAGSRNVGFRRPILDLGVTPATSKNPPAVGSVEPPQLPEGLASGFIDKLREQYDRDAFVPAVAHGQDEGSQRSALTLALRMWPLTAKARKMRDYWQTGLKQAIRIILRIAIAKNLGKMLEKHLTRIKWLCRWAPMLPRDLETMLNMTVLLVQSNALSPITALELLGIVPDPEEEYKRVQAHVEWMALHQVKGAQPPKTETAMPKATSNTAKM